MKTNKIAPMVAARPKTDAPPPAPPARNAYRQGMIGQTLHFSVDAHADLHVIQGDERLRRCKPVSKTDCLRIALDDYFELYGCPRHFGTERAGPSVEDLKASIAQLEAELAALRTPGRR